MKSVKDFQVMIHRIIYESIEWHLTVNKGTIVQKYTIESLYTENTDI